MKLNFNQHLEGKKKAKKQAAHQIFKLDIQVFFDSQPCVRNGFIQIGIQVSEHLQGKHPVAELRLKSMSTIKVQPSTQHRSGGCLELTLLCTTAYLKENV